MGEVGEVEGLKMEGIFDWNYNCVMIKLFIRSDCVGVF